VNDAEERLRETGVLNRTELIQMEITPPAHEARADQAASLPTGMAEVVTAAA